jgi:carbon-monoxide dehydrogenase medium subunit
MIPFELLQPRSLSEAIAALDPEEPSIRPIAGGTALMLMMKAGVFRPTRLISLRNVEARYSAIESGRDGLRIGALTPLSTVEHSPEVQKAAPVITRTMKTLSNVRVRNVATVGGCLAHGDPHMALGARIAIAGAQGNRELPVEELFAGYYETVLARNELIAELIVPPQGNRRAAYLKCTTRTVHDWPALGVAVTFAAEGRTISDARLVVSAATEKATRLAAAEKELRGNADDALLKRVGEAAAEEAEVTSDAHGSAAYKKELMRVYVGRAIRAALDDSMARH